MLLSQFSGTSTYWQEKQLNNMSAISIQPITGLLAISSQLILAASECKRFQKKHNLVEASWEGKVHDIQAVMIHIPRYHVR
jgi:hypothetical protein